MISSPFAMGLLDASCRGAAIILALFVIRFLLRKHVPARFIAAGWVLAALVWLIPWTLPVAWSPMPQMTAASSVTTFAGLDEPEMPVAAIPSPVADTRPVAQANSSNAANSLLKTRSGPGLIPILTVVWLLVAGTLIAGRVVNASILHRRVKRSAIPTPPRLLHALHALADDLIPDAANLNARLAEAIAWEENVKLELRAVGEVGGVPVALVDIEGNPILVTANIGIQSLRVVPFEPTATELTVTTRSGTKRVLKLENPSTFEFPTVSPAWFLSPEAIARRQENQRHESIPAAIVLSWSKINRAGKETILMNYLRTGEVVQVLETSSGGYSTASSFLFAERLTAMRRELQQKFLASLTPEQRTKFGSGASAAVRFTDSAVKVQEQMQRGKEAAARREEVVASLTPEQKKLYDEWMGPMTK